jgi:hypothetical protein
VASPVADEDEEEDDEDDEEELILVTVHVKNEFCTFYNTVVTMTNSMNENEQVLLYFRPSP